MSPEVLSISREAVLAFRGGLVPAPGLVLRAAVVFTPPDVSREEMVSRDERLLSGVTKVAGEDEAAS